MSSPKTTITTFLADTTVPRLLTTHNTLSTYHQFTKHQNNHDYTDEHILAQARSRVFDLLHHSRPDRFLYETPYNT